MKRLVILTLSIIALSFSGSNDPSALICNNGTTEVFHLNENCQGLKRCDHEVLKMTKNEALEKGMRLCGYEK